MNLFKKFDKFIITGIMLLFSSFIITPVLAAGSATVGFNSDSTVDVGSNITIKMTISNVNDDNGGVSSFEGNLSFDPEYLEYVSGTGATTPYLFQINTSANYKIAALDTSLSSGIKSNTTVFTFVFKAKKEGSTQVSITNVKLTNNSERMTNNVNPKTITIKTPVTVAKSSDATLKSLSVSGYTLSPAFNSNTTSYKITVPSTATSVNLQGSVNYSKATVTGLGNVNLNGKTTTSTIKVTAEDGTVKNYTVVIEKEETVIPAVKSSDATLKNLDVSGFTLNPTFKSSINTYAIKVSNNITGLKVTAVATDEKATVTVTGNSNWKEGNNTITIKVTAEDGTTNNYVVNVNRASSTNNTSVATKSSDNYLKSLLINSSHEMKPTFNKNMTNYNITVPYEINKLDLTAISSSTKAKVEVIGNSNFDVEKVNLVEIKVTAEDGSIRIYSLNVTRSTQKSATDLKNLEIKDVALSPTFSKNTLDYKATIKDNVLKLDIEAVPEDSSSKVEIIGNDNLKEGNNTILIKITDKEGFVKYYSINVEKEKKDDNILGFKPLQFGIFLFIILLLLIIIIILLLKRRKDNNGDVTRQLNIPTPTQPIIEVKPEFNFGSKNTSDDDVVHGNLNQNSHIKSDDEDKQLVYEATYEDKIPYNPYDEIVTKKELIDAIHEATEKRDTSKLKMLLKQEELNQMKKELKEKEELEKKKEEGKWQ